MSAPVAPHAWQLVAPWYRWTRAAVPADGRGSAPVLQKFAGNDFIENFLAQPQHSLVFDPQIDVVSRLDAAGAATRWVGRLAGALRLQLPLKKKLQKLIPQLSEAELQAQTQTEISTARAAPSAMRKLFLPAHDRHYLVVCELHCNGAGFPSVPRREVCQAGFVIRRRRMPIPDALRSEADTRSAALIAAEADLAVLEELNEAVPAPAVPSAANQTQHAKEESNRAARRETLRSAAGADSWEAYLSAQRSAVESKRAELQQWFTDQNLDAQLQAWLPDPAKGGMRWTALSAAQLAGDTTHQLGERCYPLLPLVPDPRNATHDAAGRTMYFGVVPTVLAEHDADGHACFDDQSTYEIVCFVRRHDASRPRKQGNPDCCGAVTWSAASEPYRLAPPFDLVGSAQRPITIQMPDLRDLAAQVAARPRGKFSPVKVIQPQHMSPVVTDSTPGGMMGGAAICFFSIPLITIIAMFVLNLFLPIVVLVFNLWFMLALRFCIPPQVDIGGGISADIAAQPPGIDFDAAAGVEINGQLVAKIDLHDKLKADLKIQLVAEGLPSDKLDAGLDAVDNAQLAALAQSYDDAARLPTSPDDVPDHLGTQDALVYEPHREPQWRLAAGGRG